MRRVALAFLLVLSLSSIAVANPGSVDLIGQNEAVIGLYLEPAGSTWCINGTPTPVYYFDVYVYILPNDHGVSIVEFALEYPPGTSGATITPNEEFVRATMGVVETGISIPYNSCQCEPHWVIKQLVIVFDEEPGTIRIRKHSDESIQDLQIYNCISTYSPEGLHCFSDLHINWCGNPDWPPLIEGTTTSGNSSVEILFTEDVDQADAEDVNNYSVKSRLMPEDSILISSAELEPDNRTVTLSLGSQLPPASPYVLTVTDISDTDAATNNVIVGVGFCYDLEISDFKVPQRAVYGCGLFPVHYVISNTGSESSPPFDVSLEAGEYIDGEINKAWTETRHYDGLAPQESFTDTICILITGDWNNYHMAAFLEILSPGIEDECLTLNNRREIHFWNHIPRLDWVKDVPADNGGLVDIRFIPPSTNRLHCEPDRNLLHYEIFRKAGIDVDPWSCQDCCVPGFDLEGWEIVQTVAAMSDTYTVRIPTEVDYNEARGTGFSTYMVRAVDLSNEGDTIYSYSCMKSGCSAENFSPVLPTGLEARQAGAVLDLVWDEAPDDDHWIYRLYRGDSLHFSATFESLIAETLTHSYSDSHWYIGSGYCYRLSAVDSSGNESETIAITPEEMISTVLEVHATLLQGPAIRIEWRLSSIKTGSEFLVSRCTEGSSAFISLATIQLLEGQLEYLYLDDSIEHGMAYKYRIESVNEGLTHLLFDTESINIPGLPITLKQNVPNPFNPTTKISFYLPDQRKILLEIFDVSGRRINCLVRGYYEKGWHDIYWDGTDNRGNPVSAGIYFYRLALKTEILSRKMVLLR